MPVARIGSKIRRPPDAAAEVHSHLQPYRKDGVSIQHRCQTPEASKAKRKTTLRPTKRVPRIAEALNDPTRPDMRHGQNSSQNYGPEDEQPYQ